MTVCPSASLPPLSELLPLVTYTNRFQPFETVWISPQVERLTGYAPERFVGRPGFFESILHPDDRALVLEELRASREELRPFRRDYRLLRPEDDAVWIRDESVPVGTGQGRPEFVQGYLLDVTEQKALERRLVQAQKSEELARLAAGIAHDFNNQLTAISGYTELARGAVAPESPARARLDSIVEAVGRAGKLTRQLLTFNHRQELEPEAVDLAHAVREMEPMLHHLAGEGVDLDLELRPAPTVLADVGQLEQVLMNLVANARDAGASRIAIGTSAAEVERGPESRRLTLVPGENTVLSVSDTGAGMDDETQARVFEPFFTTKDRARGTGLGLSLAQGVVRQSGGAIDLTSAVARGTTFRILLPSAGIG